MSVSRYSFFENSIKNGDPLRGMPQASFPWLISHEKMPDNHGDVWLVEIFCLQIEPSEKAGVVRVGLEYRFKCFVREANLKRMNIDPERLSLIGFENWNLLEETQKLTLETKMENMTKLTRSFLKEMFRRATSKYTLEVKKERILSQIQGKRVGGFG